MCEDFFKLNKPDGVVEDLPGATDLVDIDETLLKQFLREFGTSFVCYIPQNLIMSMFFVDQSGLSIPEQMQDG